MDDSTRAFVVAVAVAMLVLIVLSVGFTVARVRRPPPGGQRLPAWLRVAFVVQGIAVVAFIAVLGTAIIGG